MERDVDGGGVGIRLDPPRISFGHPPWILLQVRILDVSGESVVGEAALGQWLLLSGRTSSLGRHVIWRRWILKIRSFGLVIPVAD
ncbi:hypothetical protein Tco_1548719 [Tanacetum coccineum]